MFVIKYLKSTNLTILILEPLEAGPEELKTCLFWILGKYFYLLTILTVSMRGYFTFTQPTCGSIFIYRNKIVSNDNNDTVEYLIPSGLNRCNIGMEHLCNWTNVAVLSYCPCFHCIHIQILIKSSHWNKQCVMIFCLSTRCS